MSTFKQLKRKLGTDKVKCKLIIAESQTRGNLSYWVWPLRNCHELCECQSWTLPLRCTKHHLFGNVRCFVWTSKDRTLDRKEKLERVLCGDANPRRLKRQSCCGWHHPMGVRRKCSRTKMPLWPLKQDVLSRSGRGHWPTRYAYCLCYCYVALISTITDCRLDWNRRQIRVHSWK